MSELAMRPHSVDRAATPFASSRFGEETGFHGVDRPGVAWDWMRQTGQAPAGADWVRPQVAEAWARCIDDHALPAGVDFAPRGWAREKVDRDAEAWRGGSLAPVAAHLSAMVYELRALLEEANVALLLADPVGGVIQSLDPGLEIAAGGVPFARVGADWSEASLGNNGVGTASLLGEPVAFDGKEHFSPALHRLATAGCPILAPDGGVGAVLGIVSDRRDAAKLILGLSRIARQHLESRLFERLARGGYLLRLRAFRAGEAVPLDEEGRLFVASDGVVRGVDRVGLDLLGADRHSSLVGRCAAESIGVDMAALAKACESGRPVALTDRRTGRSIFAEVLLSADARGEAPGALRERPKSAMARAIHEGARGEWCDMVLEAAVRRASGLQERDIPILITGESGVGKDYLVRRLHQSGPRKDRPLVAINCAAIPRELIESELFGYEGGSFTGARSKGRAGKFVEADKGILFLDEIGDMAPDLQATLLRVLDSHEVVPIGSSKPIRVDVRVVAATNRGLQEMVQKGAFRRDLYYRLNGVQLSLPPLRERPDRLELIAHLFALEQQAIGATQQLTFADEVWRVFFEHPWPGNIREARNVLRSCIAVARGATLGLDDLPPDFMQEIDLEARAGDLDIASERGMSEPIGDDATTFDLSDWEARAVRFALTSSKGNIAKAARSLGITRATLYHKMARYGLRSDRRIVSKR